MNIEQRIALYEKLYQDEVQRGERLNSRLNVPLTVFAVIIGLLTVLFQNVPFAQNPKVQVFWILWGLSCVSLFVAFRYFCKAWYGHENKFIPTAEAIDDYYLKLRAHYFPYPNAKKLTEKSFQEYLLNSYREYATTNTENNDKKSSYLSKVTLSLTCAACFSFFTIFPYKFIFDETLKPKNKGKTECIIEFNQCHPHPHPHPHLQDTVETV